MSRSIGTVVGGIAGTMTGIPGGTAIGASIGGAIGGSMEGGSPSQSGQQAQQTADPFAPYRQQYAGQLNNLMQNPGSVQQLPGFQAQLQLGQQQQQRMFASQGQTGSGAEQIALNQYNQAAQGAAYQQQFSNLSALSGAGQNPFNAGALGVGTTNQANQQQNQNLGALGGSLGKLLGNVLGGGNPNDPNNAILSQQSSAIQQGGYGGSLGPGVNPVGI